MKSKIILEGIDGVGKTTIAERIKKENPDMNYKIIHCTRHTENDFAYFSSLLLSKENIIFDRFCYGQFIYQNKEERYKNMWLTLNQLSSLENIINHSCKVYYVYTDYETCLNNCRKDSEDSYYTIDYLRSLDMKYRYFFDTFSSVDVEYLYNDFHNVSNTNRWSNNTFKDFDYSSLPRVWAVDFDGVLAANAFPDISKAVVNEKLIKELKDIQSSGTRIILWSNRTGEALVDACNLLADYGFYPDSVNENIKEVRDNLDGGPRKVWADKFIDDKAERYIFNQDC